MAALMKEKMSLVSSEKYLGSEHRDCKTIPFLSTGLGTELLSISGF